MKSILITRKIEELALRYTENLFSDRRSDFIQPLTNLKALLSNLRDSDDSDEYKRYVRQIIRIYPYINGWNPRRTGDIHVSYFSDFTINLSKIMTLGGVKDKFYKHVTDAMRYDAVRDRDFLHYAKELGIRACVYCNANYAVTFGEGAQIKGKYELDHFKPQSMFPYLCTNFYNLYPVCANCNKAKSNTDTTFSLFTEDPNTMYPFKFKLKKESIVRYMLSQNFEDLEMKFFDLGHPGHVGTFRIEEIYGTLKDVVEELIWKHKIYNPNYMKSLNEAFSRKFNFSGFNRLILGNYDKPSEIHKRPLSKLTQDIARQLNIIK